MVEIELPTTACLSCFVVSLPFLDSTLKQIREKVVLIEIILTFVNFAKICAHFLIKFSAISL